MGRAVGRLVAGWNEGADHVEATLAGDTLTLALTDGDDPDSSAPSNTTELVVRYAKRAVTEVSRQADADGD